MKRALLAALLALAVVRPVDAQEVPRLTIGAIENRYPNFVAMVGVVDGSGNPFQRLDRTSFTIDEDGLAADVIDVRPATDPVNVIFVLDTSGSMGAGPVNGRPIDAARSAIFSALQQLRDTDNAALVTYGESYRVRSDLTYDKGYIRNQLTQLESPSGETAFPQALLLATDIAQRSPAGRRIIVLIGDGDGAVTGTGATVEAAVKAAIDADVTVQAFGFPPAWADPLNAITAATKGRTVIATDLSDPIVRTIRQATTMWAIQYRSKSPPGAHTVTIASNGARDSRSFTAPGIPPRVEAPRTLTVRGQAILSYSRVTLQSDALQIGKVEYFLDSASDPAHVATNAPWSWAWDTTPLGASLHSVTIRVTDNAGQSAMSDPIDVQVERVALLTIPAPWGGWIALDVPQLLLLAGALLLGLVLLPALWSRRAPRIAPLDIIETAAPLERTGEFNIIGPTGDLAVLAPALATIQVMKGEPEQLRHEFDVHPPVVLGRDPAVCGIHIHDARSLVSRSHAEVRIENGQFVIYDRSSKYHTFVNGKQVVGAVGVPLKDNDVINLGPTVILRFKTIGIVPVSNDPSEGTADLEEAPVHVPASVWQRNGSDL